MLARRGGSQPGPVLLRPAAQPGGELQLEAAVRQAAEPAERLDRGLVVHRDHALQHGSSDNAVQQQRYVPVGNDPQRHQQRWRGHPELRARGPEREYRSAERGRAFNAAQFSLPETGTLGTAARRFFYGPGMANFDMALHKDMRLSESRSVQLRFEAFNVFKHAQFFGPARVSECPQMRGRASHTARSRSRLLSTHLMR